MDQLQGELHLAIDHLREDIKAVRAETREDIKASREDLREWRDEVRTEFREVNEKLTGIDMRVQTVETQTATEEKISQTNWDRWSGWLALIIASFTAWVHFHK
jgi:hypothetical protein